jgi:type I restriction enzyme S subunit
MTGHILRARLNRTAVVPSYVVYALWGCPAVKEQVTGNIRGVTRPGFNTSLLESIYIPLPPLAEQSRIVAEVERHISVIEEVEEAFKANLKRAAALRQSILKRAFEGKLVPQDPNDEPASVLLERIRAERASREAEAKAAKPSRKKKPSGAAAPA